MFKKNLLYFEMINEIDFFIFIIFVVIIKIANFKKIYSIKVVIQQ